MKKYILLFLTAAIFSLNSCYYDIEEELYPSIECSTEDIQYARDILPILEGNCMVCHSAAVNFGNMTLEGHERLVRVVENGKLLGVIRHESGFPAMPRDAPKLLDCEIEKIEAWVADGALDN